MSVCKALRKDHWGVKSALKHPLVAGRKIIGRGCFSLVFEGTKKNTVLKMTMDDIGYWMLNDYCMGVKHHHFPRVVESHGDIGETMIGKELFPIYLFEMERLVKLQSGSPAARLARLITQTSGTTSMSLNSHWKEDHHAQEVLGNMMANKQLPRSVRNALTKLCDFCHNFPGGMMDMHTGNFMQRRNGELVMIDPIANLRTFEKAQKQVHQRGW